MNEKLISIIIPVYNQAKELELALISIKNQTYKNIEIIIVDDGSETLPNPPLIGEGNNTFLPLQGGGEVGVSLVRQTNQGAPVARNRGLELAKGDYVIFWDADVVGKPEMLEKLEKQLKKHPEASFAYCNYNLHLSIYNLQKIFKSQIYNLQKLRKNNYIHSTSLIRKIDAVKWDENLKRFQDWDLWLTLAEQGKTGTYVPETLFTIIAKGTMSSWLPKFAYQKPWKYLPGVKSRVKNYEKTRAIIAQKYKLNLF